MTIDTKRLASDPGYWDEVAPDGATHYYEANERWYRKASSELFCWQPRDGWMKSTFRDLPKSIYKIPRPTKAPEVEWDGEVPPVGAECDYVIGADRYPVTVVGHYNDEVVVFQHESAPDYVGVQPGYLKPQRTKEQRQRDELSDLIERNMMAKGSFWTPEECADVVVDFYESRYNLEPKDD